MYALRDLTGHCYVHFAFVFTLTLLSPSVNALSKMVSICEECAKQYDIVFNCKKTIGIQFGKRCNNCVIKLMAMRSNGKNQ